MDFPTWKLQFYCYFLLSKLPFFISRNNCLTSSRYIWSSRGYISRFFSMTYFSKYSGELKRWNAATGNDKYKPILAISSTQPPIVTALLLLLQMKHCSDWKVIEIEDSINNWQWKPIGRNQYRICAERLNENYPKKKKKLLTNGILAEFSNENEFSEKLLTCFDVTHSELSSKCHRAHFVGCVHTTIDQISLIMSFHFRWYFVARYKNMFWLFVICNKISKLKNYPLSRQWFFSLVLGKHIIFIENVLFSIDLHNNSVWNNDYTLNSLWNSDLKFFNYPTDALSFWIQ